MRGLRECCDLLRLLRATASAATNSAAASTTTAFAGALVEFLAAPATSTATPLIFALRASTTHLGLTTGHHTQAATLLLLRIRRAGAIAGSERNFEFVEFIPLGIGAIAIGNSQQFLHALAR